MLENRNSSNSFLYVACVSPDYKSESLRMIYWGLMSFAPEISSIDQDDWKNGSKQFICSNEEQLSVFEPVTTVNSLLSKLVAPSYIDFLRIDVEGAE
jgi:hypothetical protein